MQTVRTTDPLITAASGNEYSLVGVDKSTTVGLSGSKVSLINDTFVQKTSGSTSTSLVNPRSTEDKGSGISITTQKVANVYSGSKVDPLYVYPIRTGIRLYSQIHQNVLVSSAERSMGVTLPFSVSLSVKVPDASLDATQKAAIIAESIEQLLSSWFPKGINDRQHLAEMIIGKLI